jgi:hypothetical protein
MDENLGFSGFSLFFLDCVGCLETGMWRRVRDSNPR